MTIKAQNHAFIDPAECGSSVGYYLTTSEYHNKRTGATEHYINANVILSDCNHKINWTFSLGDIDKIDAAISILVEFRKKFLATERTLNRLNSTNKGENHE